MATNTTSTKEQILNLLKKQKEMTVSAIAEELKITEMAVRRHLNTLERDNVVESTLLRQAMGRPTNMYYLSSIGHELFPRKYGELTIDMLRNIQETDGLVKIKELFDLRKNKLKLRFEKRMFLKDFDGRIREMELIQNEQGFMAEVIKEKDGSYTFKEYNCPFSEVAKEFSVLCYSEIELFKELLQTEDVECKMCMATGQGPHCYYKIKESETL